jgi:hypothetical protein
MGMTGPVIPKAVLFDLLTALLDSASLWNAVAGSDEKGRAWRCVTSNAGPHGVA